MEREEQEAWELAKQLVQIDSSDPGAYEEEIGLWITDWFKKQITDFGGKLADQIHVSRLEVLPGRYNVMAKIPGKTEGPGLIYICHMDTVMLGDGWDEDISPLGAMVRDGKMYGRGACDMKSGLACALTAFKNMVKKVGERGELPEKPFSMICSVDEEDFMRGVEAAIKAGWVTKDDWILDTEPTDGQIQVAHKGRTWFELTITGITAHAYTERWHCGDIDDLPRPYFPFCGCCSLFSRHTFDMERASFLYDCLSTQSHCTGSNWFCATCSRSCMWENRFISCRYGNCYCCSCGCFWNGCLV